MLLKKIFLVLCVILFIKLPEQLAAKVICAPQLQKAYSKLIMLPEVRRLISAIEQDGPITITSINTHLSKQFGALWDPINRRICVNMSSNRSEGSIIGSILFELHNASVNSKLNRLDYLAAIGKIDRENYVRGIEYLEYINSLNASQISEKGIREGLFPPSSFLPTYGTFEEHYRIQKLGGHSAVIARNFDELQT